MEETQDRAVRRRPIRREIQRIVLVITLVSLIVTSIVGIFSMLEIRRQSEEALTEQAQKNLSDFAENKTALAEASFARYAGHMNVLSSYITGLFKNEEDLVKMGHDIDPPLPTTPEGAYAMQRALIGPQVKVDDVRDQMRLLSNLEHVFEPMIKENTGAMSVLYVGTEQGFMVGYDGDSYKVIPELQNGELYYDYRDTEWFSRGRTEKRAYFTGLYADVYGRGLMITCAAPFYDTSGKFVGVVGSDIQITNLYDAVLDIDLGEQSGAFLVDHTGHVISPEGESIALEELQAVDEMTRKQILAGKTGIRLTEDGMYHAFAPIPSAGWELVIYVPQSQVLATVRTMNKSIWLSIVAFCSILLVVLIVVLLSVRRFARDITMPLVALGQDAREISGGDLSHRVKILTNDEIGDLARDFNEMASSLQKYITDFTAMTAERERIEAELGVATKIQADMLPSVFPAFPDRREFDVYASMQPAREVGGDFYDFFLIDEDHLCVVMADVSGKGIPAAMFMVNAKTMIKNQAILGGSPSEIFARVNDQLCENNREQLFVTAWMGILTISAGKLVTVNAGHEYPILEKLAGGCTEIKRDNDPPLAVMAGLKYQENTMMMEPGDLLYVYTDGVPEAKAADGTRFGDERLLKTVDGSGKRTARETIEEVRRVLEDFTEKTGQFDDVTMLALVYRGIEN